MYAAGSYEANTTFTEAKSDCPWKTELGMRRKVAGELLFIRNLSGLFYVVSPCSISNTLSKESLEVFSTKTRRVAVHKSK